MSSFFQELVAFRANIHVPVQLPVHYFIKRLFHNSSLKDKARRTAVADVIRP